MLEQRILEIVAFACGEDALTQDTGRDLLADNLLDSLAFITLLAELDDQLGVEIQPTQVDRECWRTPDSIVEMVREKLERQQGIVTE